MIKCLPFGVSVSAQAPTWRLLRGVVHAKLDEEFGRRIFAGSVPMFGLLVCSVQFSVHPVPPGHNVEIHTRIKDDVMFGDRNLVRLTFRVATDISRVYSL